MTTPEVLRERLGRGDPDARAELRRVLAVRRAEPGGHRAWGRLCEEVGEPGLALAEYQLALRDDPSDLEARARLVVLHEERGEVEQALAHASAWVAARPADPEAVEALVRLLVEEGSLTRAHEVLDAAEAAGGDPARLEVLRARVAAAGSGEDAADEEATELPAPSEADAVRFAHLFAGRENVYARQWVGSDGQTGYSPVHEPFTAQVARNHLAGSVTVGVYPVRLDGTVTFFAFDLDIGKRPLARARGSVAEARRLKDLVDREARRLHAELQALGVPALIEDSGYKGRHLWVLLAEPEEASVVRSFGALFTAAVPLSSADLQLEFFPKQASVGGGLGNLIKLPLGIHRRTGRRSRLLRPDGTAEPDPHGALRRHPRLSRAALHAAVAALKSRAAGAPRPGPAEHLAAAGDRDGPREEGPASAAVEPVAPAPPPAWTLADFEVHPEVGALMRGCAVLAAIRDRALDHRRLTHDEQVVLKHALGHSSAGVLAVNYLLDRCSNVSPEDRLQAPLAGNPISCPKIRKRIPHITAAVPCHCPFEFAPDHYPTPRLHLRDPALAGSVGPARPRPPGWDPVLRTRALLVLRTRRRELEEEIERVEAELFSWLERAPAPEVALPEGVLRLVQEEGAPPALVWESRAGEGAPGGPEGTPAAPGGATGVPEAAPGTPVAAAG
ncbi:MAG TPA: CRISPR-associated primase-polymerase type A1 [Thermodesulfobacteriota bacterium]|nr:CRISPR-associated primase-polymerase type A1 [Thermodesulfobacteriota bacterium]